MISKNCTFSYYKSKSPILGFIITLSWQQLLALFNAKSIQSITGFANCLVIRTKDSAAFPRYYCSYYNPELIKNIFGLEYGIDDILNSYLGRKCKTAEEAQIWFMAKVLGSNG